MIFDSQIARKTARLLLKIKAVIFRPQNPFHFSSGILSPVYCDNRLIISYPRVRKEVVGFYSQVIKEKWPQAKVISGTAVGAIPQAAWVAEKLNLPLVFVRSEKKEHGTESKMEGALDSGNKAVVVEDHISTGGSILNNIRTLREKRAQVLGVVATTSYNFPAAIEAFKKEKVEAYTLTDIDFLLEAAVSLGFLKENEVKKVADWLANPKKWK